MPARKINRFNLALKQNSYLAGGLFGLFRRYSEPDEAEDLKNQVI